MSDFNMPDYDSVSSDGINLPPEGWHPSVVTQWPTGTSKAGNHMIKPEFLIDAGAAAGFKVTEQLVMGTASMFGESKLKKILECAGGFRWQRKETVEEFAAQFPKNTLRLDVCLTYEYSIQRNDQWETVAKATHDSFDGKKFVKAVITDFRQVSMQPSSGDGSATAAPVPAPVADDAKLPF